MLQKTTQHMSSLLRSQLNAAIGFSDIMLSNMQSLLDLNLRLAKNQLESDSDRKSDDDSEIHGVRQYPMEMYEIVMNTQTQVMRLFGERFEESNKCALEMINDMCEISEQHGDISKIGEHFVSMLQAHTENQQRSVEIFEEVFKLKPKSLDASQSAVTFNETSEDLQHTSMPLAQAGKRMAEQSVNTAKQLGKDIVQASESALSSQKNKSKARNVKSTDPIADVGELQNAEEQEKQKPAARAIKARQPAMYSRRGEALGRKPAEYSRKGERNAHKRNAPHPGNRKPKQFSRKGELAARKEEQYSRATDSSASSMHH